MSASDQQDETQEKTIDPALSEAELSHSKLSKLRWFRVWIRQWHRKLAIIVLLPILWFAITGILLNHAQDLKLGAQPLKGLWLKAYGVTAPDGVHLEAFDQVWSLSGSEFYLNGLPIVECSDNAVAAVNLSAAPVLAVESAPNMMALVCQSQIQIVDKNAALIESLVSPLDQPITSAFLVGADQLGLIAGDSGYVFDLIGLQLEPADASSDQFVSAAAEIGAQMIPPTDLPAAVKTRFDESLSIPGLNAERLVQDLHALRFLPAGKWLLDISAVLMLLLSVSGLMLLRKTRAPR